MVVWPLSITVDEDGLAATGSSGGGLGVVKGVGCGWDTVGGDKVDGHTVGGDTVGGDTVGGDTVG